MKQPRLAAAFAANCYQRQVQLSPRLFHLRSRPAPNLATQWRPLTVAPSQFTPLREHRAEGVTGCHSFSTSTSKLDDASSEVGPDGDTTSRSVNNIDEERKYSKIMWKKLMRTITQPVAIVTARRQDVADTKLGTLAATVSSFNSVCLEPAICISFNLTSRSSTLQALRKSGHFCLTFPANSREGADLAHYHAGNTSGSFTFREIEYVPMQYPISADARYPVSAVAWKTNERNRSSGLAFAVVCEFMSSTPVGDHAIVTAKVILQSWHGGFLDGWGSAGESAFDTSYITLAHVHGDYTNPEDGTEVERVQKINTEAKPQFVHHTSKLGNQALKQEEQRYTERLKSLRSHVTEEDPATQISDHLNSDEAPPEQVEDIEAKNTQSPAQWQHHLIKDYEERLRIIRLAKSERDNSEYNDKLSRSIEHESFTTLQNLYRSFNKELGEHEILLLLAQALPNGCSWKADAEDCCRTRIIYWKTKRDRTGIFIRAMAIEGPPLSPLSAHSRYTPEEYFSRRAKILFNQFRMYSESLGSEDTMKALRLHRSDLLGRNGFTKHKVHHVVLEDNHLTEVTTTDFHDANANSRNPSNAEEMNLPRHVTTTK